MRTPLLTLAASLVAAGCAHSTTNALNPAVEGTITSQGGELGDWRLDVSRCGYEKDKQMIILVGADPKRWVRLTGPSVVDAESTGGPYEVRIPLVGGDAPAPAGPGQLDPTCTVATGYRFGWGPLSQGGFRFDCTTPGGAHLVGRVTYADCKSHP